MTSQTGPSRERLTGLSEQYVTSPKYICGEGDHWSVVKILGEREEDEGEKVVGEGAHLYLENNEC